MQIINMPSNQTETLFKDYKFIPDVLAKELRFHENFKRISYQGVFASTSSLSVQTSKPIGNKHNCFYYEVEKLNNRYFCIGFATQNFPAYKIPGKTRSVRQSVGLICQNGVVSLYYRKLQLFEKTVDDAKTIGLGVNILTHKIFITIDGKLEAENLLPKLQVLYPTVCLRPGSNIRVYFTNFQFDLNQYMKDNLKVSIQFQKQDLKAENTLFLVKSYLRENGYIETLKSLDPEFDKDSIKTNNSGSGKKKRHSVPGPVNHETVSLSFREKHTIRYEVFKNNNWDYLLTLDDKLLFDPRLKANIILVSFLLKYFNAKDESQKLKVFQNYEANLIEVKTQKVYNDTNSIESVIKDFILEENIENHRHLIGSEHRNRTLGYLFETYKNNKLSVVMKHLDLLLKRNAEYYNFEPGHDLSNLNK